VKTLSSSPSTEKGKKKSSILITIIFKEWELPPSWVEYLRINIHVIRQSIQLLPLAQRSMKPDNDTTMPLPTQ
jgi:hypothetical protein